MQKNMIKKVLCAASILAIAAFTAGCDDDDDYHARHHRHNPPPPPPHHRPHHDNDKNKKHRNPPPRRDERPYPHRHHKTDIVGEYSATALNDASVSKGSTYNVDIFEDDGGELYLGLPNGKDYPINFENGKGEVAGGTITEEASGNFVYKDKLGGMWLVEKNQ